MSRDIGDRPFEPLAPEPRRAQLTARTALPHAQAPSEGCPGLLALRVHKRHQFIWACLAGVLLVFAGRFLYLSVDHLYMLNRYVEWSSTGSLPSAFADSDGRLQLPAEMQDRLTKLMHDLTVATEQQEPLTQQSPLIVPEVEGSTSPDLCRIDYGATPRDLCRSLARLPDNKTWDDLQPSLQSVLAAFASAMPTKTEIGCKGPRCYPEALANWLGLAATQAQRYPLVTPLIYLADDQGEVDKAGSVISYPKRTVSSGYKIGDRPWYRMPVEGNPARWLSLGNASPIARCALTDPYQDVGSVFGLVRTLVCWPYADLSATTSGTNDIDQRPRFVLAIDLWWQDALPTWPGAAIDAALHLGETLPVSLAIVALLTCLLALVSLRHQTQALTYLVRCSSLEGSQRDKSIVREVGSKSERQAGIKLAGSIAAFLSAEATRRHHNAQTESVVLRIDYEQEPDVRGIELWEIYCIQQHSFELLGLSLLIRWGVHAPRWTSVVTHTTQSLPRIEYVGGAPASDAQANGLRARIEEQILHGEPGELTSQPQSASNNWDGSNLPRRFPELDHYQRQTQRLKAGRFRFSHGVEVVHCLYPQADIEAVHRLPDLLSALGSDRRQLLQLGNPLSRIALCENEQVWEEARVRDRAQLLALGQLVGSGRLRVGFLDRLSLRLQRLNIRDFGLLDKRTLVVFDQQTALSASSDEAARCHGYVSTKRADVAFYRYVFDALWSTSERFEV